MCLGLNISTVGTLFRTEMRMVLRDRRMLLTSILLPVLVTPLMILGSAWTVKKREKTLQSMVCRCAVTGSQADLVRSLLTTTRERLEGEGSSSNRPGPGARATSAATSPARSSGVDSAPAQRHSELAEADNGRTPGQHQSALGPNHAAGKAPKPKRERFRFEVVPCRDPMASLTNGTIHLVIEGLAADETRLSAPNKPQSAKEKSTPTSSTGKVGRREDNGETPVAGAPVVRIVFRADRDESAAAMSRLSEALRETRRLQRAELLLARGFPVRPQAVAVVSEIDVAAKGQVAGLALGRIITLLLLFFVLVGGAVVATDSLAGEKERGTLETLLTTAANRTEILAAKQLVILAVALLITLIQAANLLVYVGFKLLPAPANLTAAVPPPVAALLFVLFLPVAAVAANVLLLVSGYARSYKEAQMYFLPVLLLGLLPATVAFVPGVPLRSAIVLVPIANLALAVKEILSGSYDWPMITISWLVTAAAAVWTTRLGVRCLLTERLITAGETDAVEFARGLPLFERRVWRWFAVLWAVLLLVSNYTHTADIRVQLVINLVVLFFGACCLMLRRYRLDPRAALALRTPRPLVWLGVLCGVPGGILTALGLAQLVSLFVPMPEKWLQGFGEAVFPANISIAQLLFFIAVMPGLFEEITFRGLLLHGLHRRLHPVAVALVVGVVFGLFHMTLFRLAPTACLGVLLTAVTLLTGSIYPAMLWHCLNNATGLLVYKLQMPETDLGPVCYLAGAGLLGVAFYIFWRNRTPYPGLRF